MENNSKFDCIDRRTKVEIVGLFYAETLYHQLALTFMKLSDEDFDLWFHENIDTKFIYVIAIGTDCDGYNSGRCTKYYSVFDALDSADMSNEWSDGIGYLVVNAEVASDYCRDYNKSWETVNK